MLPITENEDKLIGNGLVERCINCVSKGLLCLCL